MCAEAEAGAGARAGAKAERAFAVDLLCSSFPRRREALFNRGSSSSCLSLLIARPQFPATRIRPALAYAAVARFVALQAFFFVRGVFAAVRLFVGGFLGIFGFGVVHGGLRVVDAESSSQEPCRRGYLGEKPSCAALKAPAPRIDAVGAAALASGRGVPWTRCAYIASSAA